MKADSFIPKQKQSIKNFFWGVGVRGGLCVKIFAGGWQTFATLTEYRKLCLQRKFSIRRIYDLKLHVTIVLKGVFFVAQSKTGPSTKTGSILPYRYSWNGVGKVWYPTRKINSVDKDWQNIPFSSFLFRNSKRLLRLGSSLQCQEFQHETVQPVTIKGSISQEQRALNQLGRKLTLGHANFASFLLPLASKTLASL